MILNMTGGAGGTGKSEIIVTAPTGSTVYIENQNGKRKDAGEKNGVWTFKGCDIGTWTVNATLGEQSTTATVDIKEEGQLMRYEVTVSYVKIYGIQRDITQSSPEWVRTDDAVGFEAVASVGTQAGHSDFDNCYPWSEIHRVTFDGSNGTPSTGDVMVKIPRFWFKRWRDGNVEHIQIATAATDGFKLHPAFRHADEPKDCIYVGAYKTSSNNRSVSNATITGSVNLSIARPYARNKGDGWFLLDVSTLSAIQMLFLVEYATYNSQSAIGLGSLSKLKTGTCDSVPNLTGRPSGTDGQVDIIYRGIESLWGSTSCSIDGNIVPGNHGTVEMYVCNDPEKYANDLTGDYTQLSFLLSDLPTNDGYITQMGIDENGNDNLFIPQKASGGNSQTFVCDSTYVRKDGYDGGLLLDLYNSSSGYENGLFYMSFNISPLTGINYLANNSTRLSYIPQEVSE